jgi:hypothetical protein
MDEIQNDSKALTVVENSVETVETSQPVGRPTKYKPEFCEMLIDHMSEGYSFETFAAVVAVNRDTLYAWKDAHPEFSDAVKKAFDQCQWFWEQQGIKGLYSETEYDEKGKPTTSKSINATLWIFNMKNRFKWRDRQPDESDVVINNVTKIPDEDIDRQIEEKMKRLYGSKDGSGDNNG